MGDLFRVLLAFGVAFLLVRTGFRVMRGMATPLPPPPPEGEMRRVKLRYRCSLCGMEIRTERAATEDPDPPRHCMEDMDVVAVKE